MKILLSRTDNIGDVIFTLPMAGVLKQYYPNIKIYFLGKNYTRAIVECCSFIDGFYDWDEIKNSHNKKNIFKEMYCDAIIHVFPNKEIAYLAEKAGIPLRIGTGRRFFHWLACNKLVNLTRKNVPLHEAQLNLKLLKSFKIDTKIYLQDIPNYYGLTHIKNCEEKYLKILDKNKFNLILHPKSKGSAREWSAKHYIELCHSLPQDKFNIFFTGTKEEEKEIQEKIVVYCPQANVKSIVGLFSLSEFISFIAQCDGLIACSTGPLHIAAALGKHALGLYPPIKNMMPSRWGALGKRAQNLIGKMSSGINSKNPFLCNKTFCAKSVECACINTLTSKDISHIVSSWHSI